MAGLLRGERWVEAGPISVVQEREVVYLEDDGIFVFWNEGDPYGVLESVDEGSQPMSFCEASGTFLGPQGEVFDRRGRPLHGEGTGLPILPARMDGHVVSVGAERSEATLDSGAPASDAPGPRCPVPDPHERGMRPSP